MISHLLSPPSRQHIRKLLTSTHPVARFATGKTHYRRTISTSCDRTRPRGLRRRYRKQALQQCFYIRKCRARQRCQSPAQSKVGVPAWFLPWWAQDAAAVPVLAGVVGSKRLNNSSRSAVPTEGAVTAATTWSASTNAGSFTTYTGRALSGVGFTILRSSASAWLSHTLHLSTISRIGVSGGTLSRCRCRAQFG